MTEFTPFMSLFGGSLIGLAAVLLMAFHGRIAGMTGIVAGVIGPLGADWSWRAAFLAGAIVAPALIVAVAGDAAVGFHSPVRAEWLVAGGLLVGIGVTFGGGCTSGHGVCGIARFSMRSVAATLTFMAATAATVFIVRHVVGA